MDRFQSDEPNYFIADDAVYGVEINCRTDSETNRDIWRIDFVNATTGERSRIKISLTDRLVNKLSDLHEKKHGGEHTYGHRAFDLARYAGYLKFIQGTEENNFEFGSDDSLELTQEKDYAENELDKMILSKALRFFKYVEDSALCTRYLLLSIFHKQSILEKRIKYWKRRGFLVGSKDDEERIIFDAESLDKIEKYLEKKKIRTIKGRNFQEVPLREEFRVAKYVLMLMPFNDEKLNRNVFENIIRPVIQESSGLNCLRADDYQNAEVAHNQIYTQIVNAQAVVADISTLNPNVMIEIGVAMAEGQRVFPFYDMTRLRRDQIPFYIDRLIHHPYEDFDELALKLREIIKIE